jgi:hypothetical protein
MSPVLPLCECWRQAAADRMQALLLHRRLLQDLAALPELAEPRVLAQLPDQDFPKLDWLWHRPPWLVGLARRRPHWVLIPARCLSRL